MDFQRGEGIPLKTKIWALPCCGYRWVFQRGLCPWRVRPLLLIPGIGVTVYLIRYKTRKTDQDEAVRRRYGVATVTMTNSDGTSSAK